MIKINNDINIGEKDLCFFLGPCVIESEEQACTLAEKLKDLSVKNKFNFVFKASFDKANRTSIDSFRGPGLEEGLRILAKIKEDYSLPLLVDVHTPEQAAKVAEVADILQVPAFLCRQTDLLVAVAKTGKAINVKKGQFLAPWDIKQIVGKIESTGNKNILLTERGASFGYNNLVVDFTSIPIMKETGYPVVFDATHSLQLPGGRGNETGGRREFIPTLSKAAIAAGADAIFMEVHENPKEAKSDSATSMRLSELEPLLLELLELAGAVRK